MAARKSSRVNPDYKKRYRVRNWPEYEAGLRARGDLEIWFDEDAITAWEPAPTGKRGAQRRYSDTAIVTVLTLRQVFHLPLRQAEGFVGSLLRLMDLDLEVPDHTTLSRRGQEVEVPRLASRSNGPIHLIVDSTGLKIFGAGEWSSRKRGKKRRSWRKLHVGVDERGRIVASVLTGGEADDAITAIDLIEETDATIDRFTADGAYDRRSVYRAVGEAGVAEVKLVIPPNSRAVPSDSSGSNPLTWAQRDETLRVIDEIGRLGWQRESGYRKQGRVENTFFRFKSTLGGRLRSRNMESQQREALIGCHVLNRMFELGRPDSVAITA